MAGGSIFQELTEGQRQVYRAAVEVYRDYLDTVRQGLAHKGGMHWKKIRGREYLYRYRDRFGHGESLGRRSEETELIYADFSRERGETLARLKDQRLRLAERARFCRAALINRVPRTAARILRHLWQQERGQNLLVIGAAAIYAYEFAAGVFLQGGDLLRDAPRGLTLAGDGKVAWEEVLLVLRQADRSFATVPGEGCLAANRDGFRVRLFKSDAKRPGRQKAVTITGAREPLPPEAGHIQYLLAAPRFSQVVIGQDGEPAGLVVPDPWAFALNKLWWSGQEEREAAHRTRDRRQALAVAGLVLRHLPQYDFSPSELEMFPQELILEAEGGAEELPGDEISEY